MAGCTTASAGQKELPDVVTNSYLHSMMMAGIVAAHETTAHASANAMRLLLQNRGVWDEICANSSLIPNAVEECLRFSGSVVAWRRLAMADTQIGDVAIPKGAKLLIVTASANHDERHFENADTLDIYRDNTTDHLTFGYGSHQCMGKNLARMEMRIFLEEFTKRLPHIGFHFRTRPSRSCRTHRSGVRIICTCDGTRAAIRSAAIKVCSRGHAAFGIGARKERDRAPGACLRRVPRSGRRDAADARRSARPASAGWTPGAHIST